MQFGSDYSGGDCGMGGKANDSNVLEMTEQEYLQHVPGPKRDYLDALDLNQVRERVIKEQGWDVKRAKEAEKWYKRFLRLHKLYPRVAIVPTLDIDEMWHNHILFTRKYHEDCQRIFGHYFHHSPSGDEAPNHEFAETMKLYMQQFGEVPQEVCPAHCSCSGKCSGCCVGGS